MLLFNKLSAVQSIVFASFLSILVVGCSTTEETPSTQMVCVAYFKFDKHNLSKQAKTVLAPCIEKGKIEGSTITIDGTINPVGTDNYNLHLGNQRAVTVEKYLLTQGVPKSSIHVTSSREQGSHHKAEVVVTVK
jgi:outer membrane protein OmpA-like peptidoglycan-associated protein